MENHVARYYGLENKFLPSRDAVALSWARLRAQQDPSVLVQGILYIGIPVVPAVDACMLPIGVSNAYLPEMITESAILFYKEIFSAAIKTDHWQFLVHSRHSQA